MQDLKIRNQIKCVNNILGAKRSPIHVEGDNSPMTIDTPVLDMTQSRATFKPTQISNAEVKVNREKIS